MSPHLCPPAASPPARIRKVDAPLPRCNTVGFRRDFRHGLNGHGWGPTVSLVRASSALYQDASGVWRSVGNHVARVRGDWGLVVEGQATNQCMNHNANPDAGLIGLSGTAVSGGYTSRVSDAAALAAAGLDSEVCTDGNAIDVNNTAGGAVTLIVAGVTGNTNKHSISAFCRRVSGSGTPQIQFTGGGGAATFTDAAYTRVVSENHTPLATDTFELQVPANARIRMVLNQLEQNDTATSPVIVAGAAAIRYADYATFPYAGTTADEFSVVCAWRSAVTTYTGYKFLWEATLADGNRRQIGFLDQKVQGGVQSDSVWSALFNDPSNFSLDARNVTGMSARANDFHLFHNGSQVASDAFGTMPTTTPTIHRISNFGASQQPNAWIESLTLYPDALPRLWMETLTR